MNRNEAKSKDDKLKILLEWKKLYTEAIIDALKPSGNVLQIGFGSGMAADRIQKHPPKSHLIIESDPKTYAEAKIWSGKHPNTSVAQGGWEKTLSALGAFDAVYYNDSPIIDDSSILNHLFPEDSQNATDEVGKLLALLGEQMAKVTSKFSDKDIEDFYQKVGKRHLQELHAFFQKLRDNGNISKAQCDDAIKKYRIPEGKQVQRNKLPDAAPSNDPMLACLKECLKSHMAKGGRFSAFLSNQHSKYDDSRFFDEIITNAAVDFKETAAPLKMSDKTRDALIMIVEKS